MNFLNEATIHTSPDKLAKVKAAADPDDEIHVMEKKKDHDGDGDIDSDDYLAARDKAIKKAKSMKEGVAKDLYMKAMESSSLEEFLSDVYQDYPQHKGNSDIADYLKKYYLEAGGPIDEGKASKFLGALGIAAALLTVGQSNKSDSVLKAIDAKIEMADTPAEKSALKKLANKRLVWLDTGKGPGGDIKASDVNSVLKEAKTIELPADTTFTVDLKHLMKKHMCGGKSH